jgi:TonB family protein
MRLSIIAGLLLSPSLLHAQAGTPSTSNLEARISSPTALVSSSSPAANVAPALSGTPVTRISTGVSAPKIIHSVEISSTGLGLDEAIAHGSEMRVKFVVNEKGEPENVVVVNPLNVELDEAVVESVRQYRFRPGTLNGEVIAVPMQILLQFKR